MSALQDSGGLDETQEPSSEAAAEYDRAGCWSKAVYSFVQPLITKGLSRPLEHDDLFQVPRHDKARRCVGRLEDEWAREVQKWEEGRIRSPSLWRALYRANKAEIWYAGWVTLLEWIVMIGKPVVLYYLIGWLQGRITFAKADPDMDLRLAYALAVGLGLLAYFQAFLHHVLFYVTMRMGWNMRTSTIGLLHNKMLRLSSTAQQLASTGQIVSVVSNDCQRYDEFAVAMHFVWASPLACLAGVVIIIKYVGWQAGLAGCAAMLGPMPLQVWCGRQVGKARRHTTQWTDLRVKILSEVLSGIATVKAFVWEQPFMRWIASLREKERRWIGHGQTMKGLTGAFFFFTPSLAAFVTFTIVWVQRRPLELSTVFAVVSLLQVLRETARWTPRSMQLTAEAQVATKRIRELLLLRPETKTYGRRLLLPAGPPNPAAGETGRGSALNDTGVVLSLKGAAFTWDAAEAEPSGPEEPSNKAKAAQRAKGQGGAAQSLLQDVWPPAETLGRLPVKAHVSQLDLQVRPGELVMICGAVGAGKTTILDSLLGESRKVGGSVWVRPGTRVAYCSQKPWVQACSLRQNILFGRAGAEGDEDEDGHEGQAGTRGRRRRRRRSGGEFMASSVIEDPARYEEALDACALRHDLQLLPAGDQSQIGELGVNLSGGQRARVALARAVYADADLYLLDDVLSAVDARVAKTLFHKCIRGVLGGKAVVLVTHQVQFLPFADRVCLLDRDGRMVACQPWHQLKASYPDLSALVNDTSGAPHQDDDEEEDEDQGKEQPAEEEDEEGVGGAKEQQQSTPDRQPKDVEEGDEAPLLPPAKAFITQEDRAVGGLGAGTYLTYLRSGGTCLGLVVASTLVLSQGVLMLGDFWIKIWAAASDQRRLVYLEAYGAITAFIVIVGTLSVQLFFRFSQRASTQLHNQALTAVLVSPLHFFHSNPLGRVLNRFGKDVDTLDDLLPVTMFDFLQCSLLCLGAMVVGCLAIPYLLLLVLPLLFFFEKFRKEFVVTAREVKRLDSISRSPLYADFSSCLAGLKVIRAFRAGPVVHDRFLGLLDANGRAWFCFLVLSRHLGFRLDMLCSSFVFALSLLAVVLRSRVDHGLIGLALTYALAVSGLVQWAVRQSAQVETLMTSVERLAQYTRLPSEGEPVNPAYRPPSQNWPSAGQLTVSGLSMRYREDLPLVLKDVNLHIPGGIKVGVVGRTGSGKSSFLSTLLRLTELVEGDIQLDGVSLCKLGFADARSSIGWIPQEPHLFAGTLRFNLDPFERHTDAELWSALEDTQLKGAVSSLDMQVAEGGANLSVGQRQLLSVARAVLLKRQVLLMDEATANVDYETDTLIQTTLRDAPAFKGKSIIVIAHRINTVIDSDFIIVFSDGRVVEQGAPQDLLANPKSHFAAMVQESQGSGGK